MNHRRLFQLKFVPQKRSFKEAPRENQWIFFSFTNYTSFFNRLHTHLDIHTTFNRLRFQNFSYHFRGNKRLKNVIGKKTRQVAIKKTFFPSFIFLYLGGWRAELERRLWFCNYPLDLVAFLTFVTSPGDSNLINFFFFLYFFTKNFALFFHRQLWGVSDRIFALISINLHSSTFNLTLYYIFSIFMPLQIIFFGFFHFFTAIILIAWTRTRLVSLNFASFLSHIQHHHKNCVKH